MKVGDIIFIRDLFGLSKSEIVRETKRYFVDKYGSHIRKDNSYIRGCDEYHPEKAYEWSSLLEDEYRTNSIDRKFASIAFGLEHNQIDLTIDNKMEIIKIVEKAGWSI